LAESSSGRIAEAQLIGAMMQAAFYPHPCVSVELSETLTAWLLFAGQFVYKVKKPVRFSFIDAATPANRYRLCHDEVRLNRRLAPEVYVGVAGIAERCAGYVLVADATVSQHNVRDFAVVMHRLPGERMLDRMVAGGTISLAEIQELANKLAAFHGSESIARSKVWGSALAVSRLVGSTVAEADRLAADTVTRDRLATVGKYLRRYVRNHQQSLDNRARDGRVRHGHGDLRCASVCFAPQALAIIDCVEYSEGLRYGDVASELASLALDLEMVERCDLAEALVKAYIAASNDAELPELLRFYKCYRAVLRGTRETLTSLQTELPLGRRMLARNNASRWFAVAESLTAGSEC